MADEKKEISVREWQNKYRAGEFNNPSFETMCAAGWYDWFCKDKSLVNKAKALMYRVSKIYKLNEKRAEKKSGAWKRSCER